MQATCDLIRFRCLKACRPVKLIHLVILHLRHRQQTVIGTISSHIRRPNAETALVLMFKMRLDVLKRT